MTRAAAFTAIVALLAALPSGAQAQSEDTTVILAGTWTGTLEVSGVSLRVVFHLEAEDGQLRGTMDSPDQAVKGVPLSAVTVQGRSVRIEVAGGAATFAGDLDDHGTAITGNWSQGGSALPLVLDHSAAAPRRRPQEPAPPYPYRVDDIEVDNALAGVMLACTLARPAGDGPFPAALLLSGSGPQDRDEAAFGHRPFLVLADHLARHGVASLRCDDRGFSGSSGSFWNSTTGDFAADAEAAVKLLRTTEAIDPEKVGIIGHSEGGLTGALAAAADPRIAFLVTLAAPGIPGGELMIERQVLAARRNGAGDDLVNELTRLRRDSYDLLRHRPDATEAATAIEQLLVARLSRLSLEDRHAIGMEDTDVQVAARQSAQLMATPWFRFFLDYDPAEAFGKVHAPVLVLAGARDRQVPADSNVAAIRRALAAAGNASVSVTIVPGANHLFQIASSGEPAEYPEIEETMAPDVLSRISGWIRERGAAPLTAQTQEPAITAIRALLARWEEAFNSGDLQRMKGYWTDDVIVLAQGAPTTTGLDTFWAGLEAQVRATFAAFEVKYRLEIDEIDVSGDMAFDRGTIHMSLTPKAGGDPIHAARRYLEILRRQEDGRWLISRAMTNEAPAPASISPPAPRPDPVREPPTSPSPATAAEDIAGIWEGSLDSGAGPVRVVLILDRTAEGSLRGRVELPDYGRTRILDSATLSGDELRFAATEVDLAFDGTRAGGVIEGKWRQRGVELPLRLERSHRQNERRENRQ